MAAIAGVKPSVLRFWETRFRTLAPEKTRTNQRRYTRAQLERVLRVKALLYDEGYTIEGARRVLARGRRRASGLGAELREKLVQELRELLQLVGE